MRNERRLPSGYEHGLIAELDVLLGVEHAQRLKAEAWNWRFAIALAVAVWVGVWGWVKYLEATRI
jgi:hypothetical protein